MKRLLGRKWSPQLLEDIQRLPFKARSVGLGFRDFGFRIWGFRVSGVGFRV